MYLVLSPELPVTASRAADFIFTRPLGAGPESSVEGRRPRPMTERRAEYATWPMVLLYNPSTTRRPAHVLQGKEGDETEGADGE
jgi:hypothetical protein